MLRWLFRCSWFGVGIGVGLAVSIVFAQPTVYSLDREVGVLTSRVDNLERIIYGLLLAVITNLLLSGLQLRKGRA